MQVDDGVRPADQLGQQLVLFLAAEGNVVDGLELMARMDQSNPYEYLTLILLPVFHFLLVVHLLAVLQFPHHCVSLVEHFYRVASLVSNDVMRNELQRLHLVSLKEVLALLFFRLLLPAIEGLADRDDDLPREIDHDGLCGVEGAKHRVVLLVVSELVESQSCLFEDGLPAEDVVVEVVNRS